MQLGAHHHQRVIRRLLLKHFSAALLLCLPVASALAQPPIHRISDPALRRLLARQGFLTNGVLNDKSRRWDQLRISGEGIKSLEGVQYFTGVKALYITRTKLQNLAFLPPNVNFLVCSNNDLVALPTLPPYLEYLSCDHNRLVRLPPLPGTLTSLDCSNNRLAALPILPPRLEHLHFGHNRLTRLPSLPPKLTFLNYCRNPIPVSALPAAYRPLPCGATEQNCQPNALVNWHILNAQIPDTTFEITGMLVVISSDENMTGNTIKETVRFRPSGDYLVAGSQREEIRDYKFNKAANAYRLQDTTYSKPVNYAVSQAAVRQLIKAIFTNELVIKLQLGDTLRTVDLRYKNLRPGNVGSCSDCGNQEMDYLIYTTTAPIHLQYTLGFEGMQPISAPPSPQPQTPLLDWLYMYKLTQATIPDNWMVKHYFRRQGLRDTLRWAN